MTKNGEGADCIAEYRRHVKTIRAEEDIFFEPEDLICQLDDTCMFAQLFDHATIYEH